MEFAAIGFQRFSLLEDLNASREKFESNCIAVHAVFICNHKRCDNMVCVPKIVLGSSCYDRLASFLRILFDFSKLLVDAFFLVILRICCLTGG